MKNAVNPSPMSPQRWRQLSVLQQVQEAEWKAAVRSYEPDAHLLACAAYGETFEVQLYFDRALLTLGYYCDYEREQAFVRGKLGNGRKWRFEDPVFWDASRQELADAARIMEDKLRACKAYSTLKTKLDQTGSF